MKHARNQAEKKLGKGLVKVGEPCECGWYEDEGYYDPRGFLVVDDAVVILKKKALKVVGEMRRNFKSAILETASANKNLADLTPLLECYKEWFGELE